MLCPKCGKTNFIEHGHLQTRRVYYCKNCRIEFTRHGIIPNLKLTVPFILTNFNRGETLDNIIRHYAKNYDGTISNSVCRDIILSRNKWRYNANVVPEDISTCFANLMPKKYGKEYISSQEQTLIPADFIQNLYFNVMSIRDGRSWRVLPKLYALMYRLVLGIPTIKQLVSILTYDYSFASACGFLSGGTLGYSNIGLTDIQNNMLSFPNLMRESLHNLTDELNYKKVTISGLIPPVWVEYYRNSPEHKPIIINSAHQSMTGLLPIDELTNNLPDDYRDDVRQDAALTCFELQIKPESTDIIAHITDNIIRKYKNRAIQKLYKEKSLFSKVSNENDTELWQMLVTN
jgi:hypothetical protein